MFKGCKRIRKQSSRSDHWRKSSCERSGRQHFRHWRWHGQSNKSLLLWRID